MNEKVSNNSTCRFMAQTSKRRLTLTHKWQNSKRSEGRLGRPKSTCKEHDWPSQVPIVDLFENTCGNSLHLRWYHIRQSQSLSLIQDQKKGLLLSSQNVRDGMCGSLNINVETTMSDMINTSLRTKTSDLTTTLVQTAE